MFSYFYCSHYKIKQIAFFYINSLVQDTIRYSILKFLQKYCKKKLQMKWTMGISVCYLLKIAVLYTKYKIEQLALFYIYKQFGTVLYCLQEIVQCKGLSFENKIDHGNVNCYLLKKAVLSTNYNGLAVVAIKSDW